MERFFFLLDFLCQVKIDFYTIFLLKNYSFIRIIAQIHNFEQWNFDSLFEIYMIQSPLQLTACMKLQFDLKWLKAPTESEL